MNESQLNALCKMPLSDATLRLHAVGTVARVDFEDKVIKYIEEHPEINITMTNELVSINDYEPEQLVDTLGKHHMEVAANVELKYLGITMAHIESVFWDFFIMLHSEIYVRYGCKFIRVSEISDIDDADKALISAWLLYAIWDYNGVTIEQLFALRGKNIFDKLILCECTEEELQNVYQSLRELIEEDMDESAIVKDLEKLYIKGASA